MGLNFPAARRHEWQQLNECWQRAYAGQRQLVFVNGEPGVGKSSLVNAWQEQVSASTNVLCVRGHCLQHSGAEGDYFYLPILDVLGQLCRVPAAERVMALLARYAPNWLQQLSWLRGDTEPVLETSANPSLLELVTFIEALSKETPLVLMLEDLHWSDSATLDLLAFLARRDEPAQLAIVCTLQSCSENSGSTLHRFRQELLLHDCCQEITLNFYSPSNLADYLSQRCPGVEFEQDFCAALHSLTEGHPQFLDHIVDSLLAKNRRPAQNSAWEVSTLTHGIRLDLPITLQHALSDQREQLSALERRVLEAASVFELSFSAMELANLLDRQEFEIEEICENLVAHGLWLQRLDGRTEAGGYAQSYCFRRALYRRYIFAGLQPARKQRLQKHLVQDSNSTADYDVGIASILHNHVNPPVERLAHSTLG